MFATSTHYDKIKRKEMPKYTLSNFISYNFSILKIDKKKKNWWNQTCSVQRLVIPLHPTMDIGFSFSFNQFQKPENQNTVSVLYIKMI